ncbi:hypothetical protein C8F01DRAFT_1063324 [Mycena amicta]|nr:hypothetical protein C8F01DRAFT_1063324 [Mycena amicta]
MGSANSTASPVEFDQHLLDALADNAVAPTPSAARQNSLDAHIQARIQAQLEQLRAEEHHVREQMQAALEKENLDRERAMAGDPESIKSSAALLADLDQVRAKVDRFHARRELPQHTHLREATDNLVACYKKNPTTPLDCWQQVSTFKTSVSEIEQQHVKSLQ